MLGNLSVNEKGLAHISLFLLSFWASYQKINFNVGEVWKWPFNSWREYLQERISTWLYKHWHKPACLLISHICPPQDILSTVGHDVHRCDTSMSSQDMTPTLFTLCYDVCLPCPSRVTMSVYMIYHVHPGTLCSPWDVMSHQDLSWWSFPPCHPIRIMNM